MHLGHTHAFGIEEETILESISWVLSACIKSFSANATLMVFRYWFLTLSTPRCRLSSIVVGRPINTWTSRVYLNIAAHQDIHFRRAGKEFTTKTVDNGANNRVPLRQCNSPAMQISYPFSEVEFPRQKYEP